MTNREIKLAFIDSLYGRGEYIRQVNDIQYRTRCPFCGDSKSNLNTGHLYIKINPDDNYPMVYHCFKCEESGVVDDNLLLALNIGDINLKSNITTLNKTSDRIKGQKFLTDDEVINFNYKLPEVKDYNKIKYIEDRLGCNLSIEDIEKFKIITSLRDFLICNNIKEITMENYICHNIEKNYVGFLSFGGAYILFRDITNTQQYRWIKYPTTNDSRGCKLFYSISNSIDVFTRDNININLSEGVLDILSAYKNLNYNNSNDLDIAVCGKQYLYVLNALNSMGFVGSNINLNIFSDNDEIFNNKNNNPTNIEYFKKLLHKNKYLYNSTNIYYNLIDKDIGVAKDKIKLKKYKI
jgi:hypothetical protein